MKQNSEAEFGFTVLKTIGVDSSHFVDPLIVPRFGLRVIFPTVSSPTSLVEWHHWAMPHFKLNSIILTHRIKQKFGWGWGERIFTPRKFLAFSKILPFNFGSHRRMMRRDLEFGPLGASLPILCPTRISDSWTLTRITCTYHHFKACFNGGYGGLGPCILPDPHETVLDFLLCNLSNNISGSFDD